MRHTHNPSSPKLLIPDKNTSPPPLAMPRSILLRPPGRASGKVRKRYALIQKLMLLDESNCLQLECNLSLCQAAQVIGVPVTVLSRWHKAVSMICAAIADQPQTHNRKAILDGPASTLGSIEMDLLQFVFAKREQGIHVQHMLVTCKALSLLCDTFGPKSFNAKLKVVSRFMRKHNFVYCRATRQVTRALAEMSKDAMAFLEEIRPLLVGPHRDNHFIFNMDQTPLFFLYKSSSMLEMSGTKMIFVRKSSNSTNRAMAALTIMAAGDFLTPMVSFKGKPNGEFVKHELPTFDPTSIYACQDTAWMDKRTMHQWVDKVFGTYLAANPPLEGVIPVLLLVSYRCHMMALVVSWIQAIRVEVIHIPSGCTGLCQLLDVSVNRSFKSHVRRMWEEWLTSLLDQTNKVRDVTRKEVSEWMAAVYWELVGSRILRNCWRKMGFDWFPGLVKPRGCCRRHDR
jgi:hypothetical protein